MCPRIVLTKKRPVISNQKIKISLVIVFALVAMPFLAFAAYSMANFNRVYARQFIGDVDYGGKDKNELRAAIKEQADNFANSSLILKFTGGKEEKTFTLKSADFGLRYDVEATVAEVWSTGHAAGTLQSFWQQLRSIFLPTGHQAVFTYSDDLVNSKVGEIAVAIDQPEKDYSIVYKAGEFQLSDDRKSGSRIDQASLISNIKNQISKLKNESVYFRADEYQPQVSEEKARARLSDANKILNAGDLVVQYDTQQFILDATTIGGAVKSKTNGNDLEITFDNERINAFINTLAAAINVDPADAQLTIQSGIATIFQPSREGKTVDKTKTAETIKQALLQRTTGSDIPSPQTVAMAVDIKEPEVTEDDISNLGIKELIATVATNFYGSPTNRVHNIQTGAAALNGVLLKPDEEFSTLAKLGEISDKTGYLPELVIKDNQTVPEFGGGLCQVSTTLFRAAMAAGMKITERQNHSYRVSYYEPPIGMDATIYDPAPDFKFVNNYASYILIQSKVTGTKITFDFYGTKESRTVEISTPVGYDFIEPPAPVETETDTLPAAERQQVQKAHQGASAKFHYKAMKDGQILQETDFISKYVALPEKWLVGKQPEVVPAPAPDQSVAPPADQAQTAQ